MNWQRWALLAGIGLLLVAAMGSRMLKDLVKKFEGYSSKPYQDVAGFWTIGYGHKILPTDPYYPYGKIQSITEDEASKLLDADTQTARKIVLAAVRVPLSPAQLDALTSFVYNVGASAFQKSTLLQKLNAGDIAGATEEFGKWIYAGGQQLAALVDRRAAESNLFATG